jgi:hypothetical protein
MWRFENESNPQTFKFRIMRNDKDNVIVTKTVNFSVSIIS